MKNNLIYVLFTALFVWSACSDSKKDKDAKPLAEVLNTDTVTLNCDAGKGPLTLVYLGDQGDYVRVTLLMDSLNVEMLADTASVGKRYTTSDKMYTLVESQGNFSLYRDTALLVSCYTGQTGRELKTATGVVFVVEETHPTSASLSNIRITSRGLKEAETDVAIADADPIRDMFLADINNDGFEELYIITEVAGSGGYTNIIGLASNNDKSTSAITVPELTEADMKAGSLFDGYQGHDKIYVENKQLVREFPVYKAGDNNAKPTGGDRKVIYTLEKGEASWLLKAKPAK
ncbi:MAG: hypothetical protein FGM54_02110 [Chitinophagaceae bacterium]|nr:hypothetical protein [Chitinophagaceae bacterium]